jgi:hypothetical protein
MRTLTSLSFASALLALALGSGLLPSAAFEIGAVEVDPMCTQLLNYCVRATCTVRNVGDAPGTVRVRFDARGESFQRVADEVAHLEPGESRALTHDFREAKLSDDVTVACSAHADGW